MEFIPIRWFVCLSNFFFIFNYYAKTKPKHKYLAILLHSSSLCEDGENVSKYTYFLNEENKVMNKCWYLPSHLKFRYKFLISSSMGTFNCDERPREARCPAVDDRLKLK